MLGKRRRLEQDPTVLGPNYAILKLRPDTDCVLLFQHALSLGISDISFVSHPREFFAAEPTLLPSRTPDTPHDEPIQRRLLFRQPSIPSPRGMLEFARLDTPWGSRKRKDFSTSYQQHDSPHNSESPHEPTSNPKTELRSPSADSLVETDSDQVNQVLATLFGKSDGSHAPDEIPIIPSNGTTVCKICGAAVSCRKITNLSLHVLRSHCAVPLWRCPSTACEFSHADSGKVKNHLRNQHTGDESQPLDNRTPEILECARMSFSKCFPNVDWSEKYQNVFYLTDPPMLIKEDKKPIDPLLNWDRYAIKDITLNQIIKCFGCHQMVPLNKKAVEDHIRTTHKVEKPSQCALCDYANADEYKARMHMHFKHSDKSYLPLKTCSAVTRPHLYVKKFFPELAELIPADDFDNLVDSMKPPALVREAPMAPHQLLPVAPTVLPDPNNITDTTVESLLLQMFPAIRNGTPLSATHAHRKSSNGTALRVDRLGTHTGKVECALCLAQVEAKRTMLVSHAKSHCSDRQWCCPFCNTGASFHSKLKLHIQNSHKMADDPIDQYTPELENKWLLLFRQCFPQFAQQCYAEDWKFRSKQQQHYGNHMDEAWTKTLEGGVQPRRSILIEGENSTIEAEIKPQISEAKVSQNS